MRQKQKEREAVLYIKFVLARPAVPRACRIAQRVYIKEREKANVCVCVCVCIPIAPVIMDCISCPATRAHHLLSPSSMHYSVQCDNKQDEDEDEESKR